MTTSPEEIWSTRLQREILALTDKAEDTHSIGVLPPFVSLHDHTLDINEGHCFVEFAITVELATSTPASDSSDNSEVKKKVEGAIGDTVEEFESENIENAIIDDNNSEDTQHTSKKSSAGQSFNAQIVISLDASLKKRNSTFHATSSYPFYKPLVKIVSGAEHFDTSLNIVNGDRIYVDLEWTPSLHLNDAVQNVAVKIRESLKKKENCLTIVKPENSRAFNDDLGFEHDLLDEVKADLNKAGAKVSSFFSDLRNRATAVADELDQAVGAGTYEAGSVAPSEPRSVSSEPKRKFKIPRKPKSPTKMKVVTGENIEIGDEIDLSCEPWNSAVGLYQCKPLRRPKFITAAMVSNDQTPEKVRTMNKDDDGEHGINGELALNVYGQYQQCTPNNYLMLHAGGIREVTGAGLAGASSMFRSFTKSAKSLVEESFLMLTEELVIELQCNKFSVTTATVSWTIPVSHLAKLKFRRQESISLFFKEAPEDPIIYMCENSAEAVKQIQNVLKRHGVKGKHTNATMAKTIQSAIQMVEDIRVMEQKLEENPSAEKVTIIMDLYRQAAERFELAGDARHEECVARLREFVASPIVAAILESSKEEDERQMESEDFVSPVVDSDSKQTIAQRESEVESTTADETEEGDDADDEDLMKAMEDAENMINSAHDDLAELSIDDFDDDDDVNSSAVVASSSGADANNGINMISEFEDMLKDADKELEDLMNS